MAKATVSRHRSSHRYAKKLIDFLASHKKNISPLLILTHDFPDPDALASACALQYIAERKFKIRSRIVYRGMIGRVENRNMVKLLELPIHRMKVKELNKYTHVALVDTQPDFENNPFPDERKATLVIDQHASLKDGRSLADLLLVDTSCGATCVILAQAMLSLALPIPERLATALAYGIISDTMNLYRATRPDIIKTYLAILGLADMHTLARIQTPVYSKDYFAVLHKGIRQARLSQGLVLCHLGKVSNPDRVSQIADFLLCHRSAKWVLSTGRFRYKLHVSLRTMTMDFPAAQLLRASVPNPEDAGGHGNIAGGSVRINTGSERQFSQAEQRLETNLRQHLGLRKPGRYAHLYK